MLYIGVLTMGFASFQIIFLACFAENIAFKIKLAYFRATIEKDAKWFDQHNATEMASKISKEVSAI